MKYSSLMRFCGQSFMLLSGICFAMDAPVDKSLGLFLVGNTGDSSNIRKQCFYFHLPLKSAVALSCVNNALSLEYKAIATEYGAVDSSDLLKAIQAAWCGYGEVGRSKSIRIAHMNTLLPYKFAQKEIIKKFVNKVLIPGIWSASNPLIGKDEAAYSMVWDGGNNIQLIGGNDDIATLCIDNENRLKTAKQDPVITIYSIDNPQQSLTDLVKGLINDGPEGVPMVIALTSSCLSDESSIKKALKDELAAMKINENDAYTLYKSVQGSIKQLDELTSKIEKAKVQLIEDAKPNNIIPVKLLAQELVLNNVTQSNNSAVWPYNKSVTPPCIVQ